MSLIFVGSTELGSTGRTSPLITWIARWINPSVTAETLHQIQIVVRKCGHMAEYAILVLLLERSFRRSNSGRFGRGWPFGPAWLVAVLYAGSDELHQLFVATREASVGDVLIDSTGAALALTILWILRRTRKSER